MVNLNLILHVQFKKLFLAISAKKTISEHIAEVTEGE